MIMICQVSDYNNNQDEIRGGDIELQTSRHDSEW